MKQKFGRPEFIDVWIWDYFYNQIKLLKRVAAWEKLEKWGNNISESLKRIHLIPCLTQAVHPILIQLNFRNRKLHNVIGRNYM